MTNVTNKIIEAMKDQAFCYSKDGGQGFTNKNECQCAKDGKMCCQAFEDRQLFISYFDGVEYDDILHVYFEIVGKALQDERLQRSKWCRENVTAFKEYHKQKESK